MLLKWKKRFFFPCFSQVPSCRLTKQTSKNVADTTFKVDITSAILHLWVSEKTKHPVAKRRTLPRPRRWYVRVRIRGQETFVFRKIWGALFSCYLRFEIRLFAFSPTTYIKGVIIVPYHQNRPCYEKHLDKLNIFRG